MFIFLIVHLGSRKVVHWDVTRWPTDARVAQQLREATGFDEGPRFLILDNDAKFGPLFTKVAMGAGTELLHTAVHAPKMNAVCERFLGSARRECLDHVIILGTRHLHRTVSSYVAYFNGSRPHQGLGQQIPGNVVSMPTRRNHVLRGRVVAGAVLGGLHHDYRYAA